MDPQNMANSFLTKMQKQFSEEKKDSTSGAVAIGHQQAKTNLDLTLTL